MEKYYYIQVIDKNKIKFITKIDNTDKMSYWADDDELKIFDNREYAEDIVYGLCLNGFYAFVVESPYKLEFKNKDLK